MVTLSSRQTEALAVLRMPQPHTSLSLHVVFCLEGPFLLCPSSEWIQLSLQGLRRRMQLQCPSSMKLNFSELPGQGQSHRELAGLEIRHTWVQIPPLPLTNWANQKFPKPHCSSLQDRATHTYIITLL